MEEVEVQGGHRYCGQTLNSYRHITIEFNEVHQISERHKSTHTWLWIVFGSYLGD
jgi:hypothetical protein